MYENFGNFLLIIFTMKISSFTIKKTDFRPGMEISSETTILGISSETTVRNYVRNNIRYNVQKLEAGTGGLRRPVQTGRPSPPVPASLKTGHGRIR